VHRDRAGAGVADLGDLGVLVDLDAQLRGHPGQLMGEPGRVHQGAAAVPVPGQEQRAVDLRPNLVLGEVAGTGLGPVQLVGLHRHGEHSRAFELAVQAELGHVRREPVQVGQAEAFQLVQLVGPAVSAVGRAVGQAGLAEPPVAAGRGPADLLALQQDHPGGRVAALGPHRGPEPGVPAADDRQIGRGLADERAEPRRRRAVLQPEHLAAAADQRGVDQGRRRRVELVDGPMRRHGAHR
jgi:hypothetical protein